MITENDIFNGVTYQFQKNAGIPLESAASRFGLSYAEALILSKQSPTEETNSRFIPIRVALLGPGNLQLIEELFLRLSKMHALNLKVKTCLFDSSISTILDPDSFIYKDSQDVIILLPDRQRLESLLEISDSKLIEAEINFVMQEWVELASKITSATTAKLIVSNLPNVSYDYPGPKRSQISRSLHRITKYFNFKLSALLPKDIALLDLEYLSSKFGSSKTYDERIWVYGKFPFSPDFSVCIVQELLQMILHDPSRQIKLIILDLDETLWGGSLAEEGPQGIELGGMTQRGEGFQIFQRFLKQLKEAGTLLAICSRNDKAIVLQTLEEHPEMVLRAADFISIEASWGPKSVGVEKILTQANIHAAHALYIDDNPGELFEVVSKFQDVSILMAQKDPTETLSQIRQLPELWLNVETPSDRFRTEQYGTETLRQSIRLKFATQEDFLKSLEIKAKIEPFNSENLPRIAQLIQRSNQFNLSTRRKTESEIKKLMSLDQYQHFSIRLSDIQGDYGIIGVVIAEIRLNQRFLIETWLMSCRVLNRQVENITLRAIYQLAKNLNCTHVVASYIPSTKNALVENLLPQYNFSELSHSETEVIYEKALADPDWPCQPIPIEIVSEGGGCILLKK